MKTTKAMPANRRALQTSAPVNRGASPLRPAKPAKRAAPKAAPKKAAPKKSPPKKSAAPCISKNGHATHVTGNAALVLQQKILGASKMPVAFKALLEKLSGHTENQVRYQLAALKGQGAMKKTGNREMTRWQAAP